MTEPKTFDSDEELLSFLRDYCTFGEDRVYLLIGMARPRENENISHGNIPIFREIITDEESIARRYARLRTISDHYTPEEGGELTFRFYITANARDIEKSFYLFKKELLEFTYRRTTGHEGTKDKIKRLDKEWKSTLQTAGNKDEDRFIIDIDSEDESLFEEAHKKLSERTEIIESIKSPNGYHIITEPFGYPQFDYLMDHDDIEIKTDGLMFLRML